MLLPTRRKARRNKERRQLLIDVPLDVLIEVFLFLEPLDLLHLARTTKALRAFFLNQTEASALWTSAIGNVKDFPPCPGHMSAPAYTHLAFVPVCHGCFCPCKTIEWELRMRCCPDCFPKMTIARDSVDETNTYMNALYFPMAYKHYKLFDGGLDITVQQEIIHSDYVLSRLDWKVVQSRERPQNISTEEFAAQQNEYWGSIRRHARFCQDWEHRRLKEQAAQLSLVRGQRVKDIKDKLRKLGWTDDIWSSFRDYNFLRLHEVSKLEPLTPTEWAKIHPELVSWARKTRKDLIWNLYMSTFTSISFSIQQELRGDVSLKVKPREIDIAMLPAVRSILESGILEIDIDSDAIRDNLMQKFLHVLPPAIRTWSSDAVEELEQFAREQLGLPPRSKPSCLPSVIFQCNRCSRGVKQRSRFTFEEVLSHGHLYREKHSETGEPSGEMSLCDKLLTRYPTHPRNIQVLQVDITISRRVENLIKKMGQNPLSATHDELRRSTVKVICGLCRPEVTNSMNFQRALDHCLSTHVRDNRETQVWTCASVREKDAFAQRDVSIMQCVSIG